MHLCERQSLSPWQVIPNGQPSQIVPPQSMSLSSSFRMLSRQVDCVGVLVVGEVVGGAWVGDREGVFDDTMLSNSRPSRSVILLLNGVVSSLT